MLKSLIMRVIVIGAGASGVVSAISYKRKHPLDDVLIIEHLDKPLKKILATGNGKCNLGNANLDFSLFNNEQLAKSTLKDYNYEEFFDSINIKTKLIGDLAYPVSESAISIRDALLNEVNKLGIKINLEENFVNYKLKKGEIIVLTTKNIYTVDKLILAGGLLSSPKLGSDGSVINILERHGYKVNIMQPGLSPVYTKEKTNLLDGIRCKAKVTIKANNNLIHEEKGELLFKDHGLSGIVIFNSMSYIARSNSLDVKLYIDLLPEFELEYLEKYEKEHGLDALLLAFINPKISDYLLKRFLNKKEIVKSIKNLEFTFDKSYGYDFSQVTVGGIDASQINENFESNLEKNVYIIGELIDIDGPCGGYNLSWAFGSALKVGD